MVAQKLSKSTSQHQRHGVWVPAFAGTTAPAYKGMRICYCCRRAKIFQPGAREQTHGQGSDAQQQGKEETEGRQEPQEGRQHAGQSVRGGQDPGRPEPEQQEELSARPCPSLPGSAYHEDGAAPAWPRGARRGESQPAPARGRIAGPPPSVPKRRPMAARRPKSAVRPTQSRASHGICWPQNRGLGDWQTAAAGQVAQRFIALTRRRTPIGRPAARATMGCIVKLQLWVVNRPEQRASHVSKHICRLIPAPFGAQWNRQMRVGSNTGGEEQWSSPSTGSAC